MTKTAIDLFCGSGGVTAGLKRSGWSVLAAVDIDPTSAETYRLNHKEVSFLQADIRKRSTIESLKSVVGRKQLDLLVVCAPCQPFSSQNRSRGGDPRETLILKSIAAVRALMPRLVFFENVPGLVGPSYADLMGRLVKSLRRAGYFLSDPTVEDAATYGVPQRRRRCIMLAARDRKSLDAFKARSNAAGRATVRQAIGDLSALEVGEHDAADPLHRARAHSSIALKRLKAIPKDGGSRVSLPKALVLECHKEQRGFPDVYGRMKWDDVAPTLTTGCTDVTRGRFAHPEQDRAITLREAARLQTFDDTYRFAGNVSEIATQIGNAVPPLMIAKLAEGFEAALNV